MRSDSLKHKLLLSNPDFTTELCDKWASRSMLQGRLGVIEGLLFVKSPLGNQQGPTGSRYPTHPKLFFKYPTRPDPKIENDWVPGN